MFCQIVSLPRSGSHMLGSALSSHPELVCIGEYASDDFPEWANDGNCQIVQLYNITPNAEKYIVLVRSLEDRKRSWRKDGPTHYYEPINVSDIEPIGVDFIIGQDMQQKLQDFIGSNKCLILHYEELTGNADIRQIPDKYGRMICEYLEVEYQPLVPATYKPT